MKILTYLLLATGILITSTISCRKKEEEKKANPDITLAKETGESKTADDADINILNDQAQTLGGAKKTSTLEFPVGTNITTTISTSNLKQDTTWTVTIDFGNSTNGLYCAFDGMYRKGKIIYKLTEIDANNTLTGNTTFDGYYIGKNKADIKREGEIIETYRTNGSLEFEHTYQVKNAKLTRSDGKIATWQNDYVRTWKVNLTNSYGGYYQVKGSGNGTTYNGTNYEHAIDQNNPLIYERPCIYPSKGIVTYTDKSKNKTYIFDYNTGNCNTVNISVDGQTQTMNIGLQ